MMHPSTELRHIDEKIGFGVVATALIPRGTITWVRDELDQAFKPEQVRAFPRPYQAILEKYAYLDGNGDVILCWDHARFVNHSCEPSCLSAGWPDFEIAGRDIEPGQPITDEYGTLNHEGAFECLCGSKECRKQIKWEDMYHHADRWDAKFRAAFPLVKSVDQPLLGFVRSRIELEQALRGQIPVPSVRQNHHPPKQSEFTRPTRTDRA